MKQIPLWGAYALLAYMPFHVFLSQSLSTITGGLSVWKLAKDVFIVALAALCVLLVWRSKRSQGSQFNWYVGAISGYLLLHVLLYLGLKGTSLSVALLATIYNVRLLLLFIVGLSVALLLGKRSDAHKLIKFVLFISTIVAALGVIQYFLPTDFLTHFGYSEARGVKPSFLIDNKADLPRIMSTLREPNSLGAFLVVPIVFLSYKFIHTRRRMLIGGLLLLHGLALLLTFSRSAWLTMVISESTFLFVMYQKWLVAFCRRHAVWLVAVVVMLGLGAFTLRDQYFVQNTLFHSDEHTVGRGSDEKHLSSIDQGIKAIADQPQGYGPGTAGPVSLHTTKPFITENYYVQLGYELGVIGLVIFIAVCVAIFLQLRAIGSWEAKALLATFVGYAVCNLFLHTWTNEAVATQWWLLAGVVIGSRRVYAHKPAER